MHRTLLALALLPACELATNDGVPHQLDGTVSSPDVTVASYVNRRRCGGQPCTDITIQLYRDGKTATDTTASVTADGAPSVAAAFDIASGKHHLVLDHWIDHVQIDATAGSDHATMSSTATITGPDEADVQLADIITLGSTPSLRWEAQGRPVTTTIIFATQVPALRFGFLVAREVETGSYDFGPSLFTTVGTYNIDLIRELEHFTDDDRGQLTLSWLSDWQKIVTVVQPPPT